MTVATELADLVWENPGVREQVFLLCPSRASLPPRCPSGVADRFAGPVQHVFPYDEAIASWASGEMRYFGLVPRKKSTTGSRLEVIERYWGLWVDLDDPGGLEAVERELRPLEFWPSAIVSTGSRGHHLYFRLATSLPLPLIELYNRALAELVGGDAGSSTMPNNTLRVPGSVHEKSGETAQFVEMSGTAYGEDALRRLNAGLVPVLESVMEKLQHRRRLAERKLELAGHKLATSKQREQRDFERHLRLQGRQKRLDEFRDGLNRRSRALAAQRKALELRGDNGRRPLVAQRLRRRLSRLVRALVPTRSAS